MRSASIVPNFCGSKGWAATVWVRERAAWVAAAFALFFSRAAWMEEERVQARAMERSRVRRRRVFFMSVVLITIQAMWIKRCGL